MTTNAPTQEVTICDAAAYILEQFDGSLSTMKLQKLLYFSQGWALALMRRPLFNTEFEAWKWGPVSYDLYLKHKGEYEVNQIPGGDAAKILGDDRILIDAVVKNYGGLSGMQLGDLTHQPNTPWTRVRNEHGIPKGQGCRIVIPNQKIEQYFIEALSVERIQSEIAC